MDREVVLLQQLKTGIVGWLDVIRRSTGVRELQVELGAASLSIVGAWYVGTAAERREHKKTFGPAVLFGNSLELCPAGRRLVKRPCDCAREFIREVLDKRGALS